MAAPKLEMRAVYDAQIADWVSNAQIMRYISTVDTTGRESGAFASVKVDEPVWIQAISRGNEEVEEAGQKALTTHLCFQYWNGFQLLPQDKIYWTDESGQEHIFDVVRAHLKESHRVAELNEVKREPE